MPHIKICSKRYIQPPLEKGGAQQLKPMLYDEPVVRELIKLGELRLLES